MSEYSIFLEKNKKPSETDLKENLGGNYEIWKLIIDMVSAKYPARIAEWNFPGKRYGWNFRIKDKRRTIIYLLPLSGYFKVAFVYGDKALSDIYGSDISDTIKDELMESPKYGEGTGIRLSVKNRNIIPDIEKLIDYKLKY